MKEKDKNIHIEVSNISSKQWANLLIELNLIAKSWKSYGPIMKNKAHNIEKIIKWGRKRHDESKED